MSVSLQNIIQKIKSGTTVVELQGLSGSSKALVLSMLSSQSTWFEERTKPLIVVCESFDIAEVLLNDLYYYSGRKGIYFFPFWDVLPYDNFSPHKGLISQRFQTLDALLKGEVRILVTTPNAMMQRFMPRDSFQKNTIIFSSETVGLELNRQKLLSSGYNQVDVVEDHGEFSTHGLIIDVFPLNSQKPVRMEFSEKNRLLYLKPFDIQTQCTTDAELDTLEILPGNEIIFNKDTINYAHQNLPSFRKECTLEFLKRLKESLRKSQSFPGIESLSPLFYPKPETLFDYLPSDYQLVIDEETTVKKRAENFFQEVFMEYELSSQQNKLTLSPELLFLTNRELELRLENSAKLYLNSKIQNGQADRLVYQLQFVNNHSLRQGFEKNKATSAAGHMVALLQSWYKSGVPILLSARNQTHADHFQQLLEDLGVETFVAGEQLLPEACPWLEWL